MIENRDEAARWFAVLHRGLMTPDERADYEAWHGDAANAAAIDALHQIWRELEPASTPDSVRQGDISDPVGRDAYLSRPARVAGMLSAASLMFGLIYRLDGSWWTALDWWSR